MLGAPLTLLSYIIFTPFFRALLFIDLMAGIRFAKRLKGSAGTAAVRLHFPSTGSLSVVSYLLAPEPATGPGAVKAREAA